jgi:hypothetical protein
MPLKFLVLPINFHLPGISFCHGKNIESLLSGRYAMATGTC